MNSTSFCWVPQAPARRPPSPGSRNACSDQSWSCSRTRRWRRSSRMNFGSSFPGTPSSTSCLITTTTSLRRTCRRPTPTSKGLLAQRGGRAAATLGDNSLLTRRDVIVVATVSAIYGLGTPQEYVGRMIKLQVGQELDRTPCCADWWASSTRGTTFRQPRDVPGARGHPRGVPDV